MVYANHQAEHRATLHSISVEEAAEIEAGRARPQTRLEDVHDSAQPILESPTEDAIPSHTMEAKKLKQLVTRLCKIQFPDTASPSVLVDFINSRLRAIIRFDVDRQRCEDTWLWAGTDKASLEQFNNCYFSLMEDWCNLIGGVDDAIQPDESNAPVDNPELTFFGKGVTAFVRNQVQAFTVLRQGDAPSLRQWFKNFAHVVSLPWRLGSREEIRDEVWMPLAWVVLAFYDLGTEKELGGIAVIRNGLYVVRHLVIIGAFNDATWNELKATLKSIDMNDEISRIKAAMLECRAPKNTGGDARAKDFDSKFQKAETSSIFRM